jgi:hypothetical protein
MPKSSEPGHFQTIHDSVGAGGLVEHGIAHPGLGLADEPVVEP